MQRPWEVDFEPTLFVCTGDTHWGSDTAMICRDVELPKGATYSPGPLNVQMADWWQEFHHDYVPRIRDEIASRHGGRCKTLLLVNGDLLEGDHHNTAELISRYPGTEFQVGRDAMEVARSVGYDAIFCTTGTETHTGKHGEKERGLIKALAEDGYPIQRHPDTGDVAPFVWDIHVGGWRFEAQHHGSMGRTPRTKGSQAALKAADVWIEQQLAEIEAWASEQKDGVDPAAFPHVRIGSHWHQFASSAPPFWNVPTQYVTLPCWQFKTGHANKVASDSRTRFGGVLFMLEPGVRTPVMDVWRRLPRRRSAWKGN